MKKKIIFIAIAILAILKVLAPVVIDKILFNVPENKNIIIPIETDLKIILSADFGNSEYQEIFFDKNQSKETWLPLCHEALNGIDDAEDTCKGFENGYMRQYQNSKIIINKYENSVSARDAAKFLIIDADYPVEDMNNAKVISSRGHYTLVAGQYLITAKGSDAINMISTIINFYQK
jgi:hypothetical protein